MGLFRKSGGGKLNNVDATITKLELTTQPFGDKTSDKFGEQLYAVLYITPDGAEDPVFTPLKIGKAENYTIESDYGLSTDQSDVLHPASQMGKLVASMVEAGVSAETFVESDDAQEADFAALVGGRFRFTYRDDAEVQEKFGKKKYTRADGTKGEADRKYLAVSAVYELGESVTKPHSAPGRGRSVSAKVETPASVTEESIAAVLRESPGRRLQRSKLAAKLALKLGKGHAFAKQVQELVNDDSWMNQKHAGFSYNDETQELKAIAA